MLVCLVGCAEYVRNFTPEAQHEEFLKRLHDMIGMDINANDTWLRPGLKLGEERLVSGLIRYRFGVVGHCIKDFDVDPATNKIVAVDFEGTDKECISPL
jgi:hypothetical protein